MSGYRSRYVSPPRTRQEGDHNTSIHESTNHGGIHRAKSFQPTEINHDKYSSLEEAWQAMRAATMRVQSGDEHGKVDLKAATKAVKKMMIKEQQQQNRHHQHSKEVPEPPQQPAVRRDDSPLVNYYNPPPPQTSSSKRHSSPPRRRLRETNKNGSDLTAFDLDSQERYQIPAEDRKAKSSKKKKSKDDSHRRDYEQSPQPSGRLEFLSEPSDRIEDVRKSDACVRKGNVTPGDMVRGPPRHTPPKGNMIDEALKDVNMNTFTPAPKPFVMDLSVDVTEAIRESTTSKRLPAAIPLNRMEPIPLAVTPFTAADPIEAPGGEGIHQFGTRSPSPMAGVNSKQPPTMECYLVELGPTGAAQYHQRFLHFHGSSQIVFSKSASDGADPSDFIPREEVAVTSLLSFAPATKDGATSHNGMVWFVITTTFTEYQAIAVDPKLLREWISWLSSRHPLIQTGSTTVVLH